MKSADYGGDFFRLERERMVDRDLAGRGVRNPLVLTAFRRVPRERFVPSADQRDAYVDHPLPIGERQTISQPYIVALMIEALDLKPGARVLEIGTGSGYQTALLLEIAAEVFSVERLSALADAARQNLEKLGYSRFRLKVGDGTLGWPEHAPYDAIIVSAAAAAPPVTLQAQLGPRGRLIAPVGGRFSQQLTLYRKIGRRLVSRDLGGCSFVPLVGAESWSE